jgi:hypothetical protein
MTLWKRILAEKRPLIVPLLVGVLINVGVYAFVVHPLGVKSATAADHAAATAAARRSAERDYAAARGVVTGKTRADQELSTFYDKVLPAGVSSARRLTYSTLPELARKANVKFAERRTEVDETQAKKKTGLGRLAIGVVLQGEYERLRQFIYQLESAPEFVIIDDVTLAQNDPTKPLTLTLQLSTYYRQETNGN